ncbi:MAG TPA: AMP-binding protein, partial [Acidimicrobiales bacterium]
MADIDFLKVHAEGNPSKPALILGDNTVDFSMLNSRANKTTHLFSDLGCEPRDRVAIMSFNSIAGFEITAGLRRAGLIAVPVNYRLRGPEVAYVLNDSGAKVVCADDDHVDVVDAARPDVKGGRRYIATGSRKPDGWWSYRDLMTTAPDTALDAAVSGGLGASMIYTSGTTGYPKGAWRPNGVNIENVLQVISIFGLNQSGVHLMCGPGY